MEIKSKKLVNCPSCGALNRVPACPKCGAFGDALHNEKGENMLYTDGKTFGRLCPKCNTVFDKKAI